MLTFKEKRSLQGTVEARLNDLEQPDLKFMEKRKFQVELDQALNRLDGEKTQSKTPLYDALVAGKHDKEPPLRFLARVEAVVRELGEEFEPVKAPVVTYTEKNVKPKEA